MSFLESIQHGLEKASQEASRITKIQHLHNVVNDLNFKTAQEGQTLIGKAMEMYQQGILAQGELTAVCQQIATYQQQLTEIHEELQRLQKDAADAGQQIPQPPQPAPAYAPGTVPPAYTAYPTPPTGYPAYPAPAPQAGYPYPAPPVSYPAYPVAPASPSGEPPTKPGAPVEEDEPPTQPLSLSNEPPAASLATTPEVQPQAQTAPHKPHQHHTAAPEASATNEQATPAAGTAPTAVADVPAAAAGAPAGGTYAHGMLPPIFSPFTAKPTGAPTAAPTEAEAEKPARAHHTKKAADDTETPNAPVAEK